MCYIYNFVHTVAIPKLRFCSHWRISLAVRFTNDRGLCSCVHARWYFLTRERIVPLALVAHFPYVQGKV